MKYRQPGGVVDENAAYVDGNPAGGIRGSIVPARAIEAPQREIQHCIVSSGQTPDPADNTQLWDAIVWAAGQYGGGGGGGGGPYLPLAGGSMENNANVNFSGTGAPRVNGVAVWHPGNDGAGSGLDADLLGGVAHANYARNNRDSEPLANGKVRLVRRPLEANRGRLELLGQDTQNGGAQIDWMSGDGATLSMREELTANRRNYSGFMYSDGGNTTFEKQWEFRDIGDLWLRKLNGTVFDALATVARLIAYKAPPGPGVGGANPRTLNMTVVTPGLYRSYPTIYNADKTHVLFGAQYTSITSFVSDGSTTNLDNPINIASPLMEVFPPGTNLSQVSALIDINGGSSYADPLFMAFFEVG